MIKVVLFICLLLTSFHCTTNKDPVSSNNTTEPDTMHVRKPNVYIYPQQACELTLSLHFPFGGEVTESIPPYLNGWSFYVEPSGLIDHQFHYLFYECLIPKISINSGWIVKKDQLETFFTSNMYAYGFNTAEITDFTEYWIPRLNTSLYYKICPVYTDQFEQYVKFEFSKMPDAILRVIYLVSSAEQDEIIQTPIIPQFKRIGFTVTEWGVIFE